VSKTSQIVLVLHPKHNSQRVDLNKNAVMTNFATNAAEIRFGSIKQFRMGAGAEQI
jgi:hypothetical protein